MSTITIILDEDKAALVGDYLRMMRQLGQFPDFDNAALILALATGIERILQKHATVLTAKEEALMDQPPDHFTA